MLLLKPFYLFFLCNNKQFFFFYFLIWNQFPTIRYSINWFRIIFKWITIPFNFLWSASFLSQTIFSDFEVQFEHSWQIIVQKFSDITSLEFSNLMNKSLVKFFFLETLTLPSEDFYSELPSKSTKKVFTRFVIFLALSCHFLIRFIQYLIPILLKLSPSIISKDNLPFIQVSFQESMGNSSSNFLILTVSRIGNNAENPFTKKQKSNWRSQKLIFPLSRIWNSNWLSESTDSVRNYRKNSIWSWIQRIGNWI
jgi:hypothetical protein